MNMIPLLCILALLSSARSQETGTSVAEDIDAAHAILLDVAITFHDSIPLADINTTHLSEILTRVSTASDSVLPESIRGHPTWQHSQQNLEFALFRFDILRSQSTNHDTVRDGFRELFYAFHRLCRPYLYLLASTKPERRILLFAASITCECTRRMCDEYIAELARQRRELRGCFGLVIIDSVFHPELMTHHKVETIPTAIAVDAMGNEIGRVQGDDQKAADLNDLINRMLGGTH